jgi:hypothetical protein
MFLESGFLRICLLIVRCTSLTAVQLMSTVKRVYTLQGYWFFRFVSLCKFPRKMFPASLPRFPFPFLPFSIQICSVLTRVLGLLSLCIVILGYTVGFFFFNKKILKTLKFESIEFSCRAWVRLHGRLYNNIYNINNNI